MNELQKLVAGILNDLISARYEADTLAAEYTKLYRDDPVLQTLNAPTLNITNVSVDLRMAIADPGAGGTSDAPDRTEKSRAGDALKKDIVDKEIGRLQDSVFEKVKLPETLSGARLGGAKRAMSARLAEAMAVHDKSAPPVRKAALAEGIIRVLEERDVKITPREMKVIERDIDTSASRISTASAIANSAGTSRAIITDAETLAKMNPEAISSIKFDVDLEQLRWIDIADDDRDLKKNADEDGDGDTKAVLGGI